MHPRRRDRTWRSSPRLGEGKLTRRTEKRELFDFSCQITNRWYATFCPRWIIHVKSFGTWSWSWKNADLWEISQRVLRAGLSASRSEGKYVPWAQCKSDENFYANAREQRCAWPFATSSSAPLAVNSQLIATVSVRERPLGGWTPRRSRRPWSAWECTFSLSLTAWHSDYSSRIDRIDSSVRNPQNTHFGRRDWHCQSFSQMKNTPHINDKVTSTLYHFPVTRICYNSIAKTKINNKFERIN